MIKINFHFIQQREYKEFVNFCFNLLKIELNGKVDSSYFIAKIRLLFEDKKVIYAVDTIDDFIRFLIDYGNFEVFLDNQKFNLEDCVLELTPGISLKSFPVKHRIRIVSRTYIQITKISAQQMEQADWFRKIHRIGRIYEPATVQISISVPGINYLPSTQLLPLDHHWQERDQQQRWQFCRGRFFSHINPHGYYVQLKPKGQPNETQVLAFGNPINPSMLYWRWEGDLPAGSKLKEQGRQLGLRYQATHYQQPYSRNNAKNRTYGGKVGNTGLYKIDNMTDGHGIQACDDQFCLHMGYTHLTADLCAQNMYWENPLFGMFIRQDYFEDYALRHQTYFLQVNEFSNYFVPSLFPTRGDRPRRRNPPRKAPKNGIVADWIHIKMERSDIYPNVGYWRFNNHPSTIYGDLGQRNGRSGKSPQCANANRRPNADAFPLAQVIDIVDQNSLDPDYNFSWRTQIISGYESPPDTPDYLYRTLEPVSQEEEKQYCFDGQEFSNSGQPHTLSFICPIKDNDNVDRLYKIRVQHNKNSPWKKRKENLITASEAKTLLDQHNKVGNKSLLTYDNMLFLMESAFKKYGLRPNEHTNLKQFTCMRVVAVGGKGNTSLRDAILDWIGQEPPQTKISIALCMARLNPRTGKLEGDAYWSALHLRRSVIHTGKAVVQICYMHPSNNPLLPVIKDILSSINRIRLQDLDEELRRQDVYRRAVGQIPHVLFPDYGIERTPLPCPQQKDSYSSGYHAVFNLIRMHNADDPTLPLSLNIVQKNEITSIDLFIEIGKQDLNQKFGSIENEAATEEKEVPKSPILILPEKTSNPTLDAKEGVPPVGSPLYLKKPETPPPSMFGSHDTVSPQTPVRPRRATQDLPRLDQGEEESKSPGGMSKPDPSGFLGKHEEKKAEENDPNDDNSFFLSVARQFLFFLRNEKSIKPFPKEFKSLLTKNVPNGYQEFSIFEMLDEEFLNISIAYNSSITQLEEIFKTTLKEFITSQINQFKWEFSSNKSEEIFVEEIKFILNVLKAAVVEGLPTPEITQIRTFLTNSTGQSPEQFFDALKASPPIKKEWDDVLEALKKFIERDVDVEQTASLLLKFSFPDHLFKTNPSKQAEKTTKDKKKFITPQRSPKDNDQPPPPPGASSAMSDLILNSSSSSNNPSISSQSEGSQSSAHQPQDSSSSKHKQLNDLDKDKVIEAKDISKSTPSSQSSNPNSSSSVAQSPFSLLKRDLEILDIKMSDETAIHDREIFSTLEAYKNKWIEALSRAELEPDRMYTEAYERLRRVDQFKFLPPFQNLRKEAEETIMERSTQVGQEMRAREQQLMQRVALKYDLTVKNVPDKGNCFFDSVSDQLEQHYHISISADRLRLMAMEQMRCNPIRYADKFVAGEDFNFKNVEQNALSRILNYVDLQEAKRILLTAARVNKLTINTEEVPKWSINQLFNYCAQHTNRASIGVLADIVLPLLTPEEKVAAHINAMLRDVGSGESKTESKEERVKDYRTYADDIDILAMSDALGISIISVKPMGSAVGSSSSSNSSNSSSSSALPASSNVVATLETALRYYNQNNSSAPLTVIYNGKNHYQSLRGNPTKILAEAMKTKGEAGLALPALKADQLKKMADSSLSELSKTFGELRTSGKIDNSPDSGLPCEPPSSSKNGDDLQKKKKSKDTLLEGGLADVEEDQEYLVEFSPSPMEQKPVVGDKQCLTTANAKLFNFGFCFGEAYSQGDCFYDSVMQAIPHNRLPKGAETWSRLERIKWARKQCSDYANELNWDKIDDDEEDNNWVKRSFFMWANDPTEDAYKEYLDYVKYNIEDYNNRSTKILPIWGSDIDMVILCVKLDIKIHICRVGENGEITHRMTDKNFKDNESPNILITNPDDIDYNDENIVHIGVDWKNTHFVPVIRNSRPLHTSEIKHSISSLAYISKTSNEEEEPVKLPSRDENAPLLEATSSEQPNPPSESATNTQCKPNQRKDILSPEQGETVTPKPEPVSKVTVHLPPEGVSECMKKLLPEEVTSTLQNCSPAASVIATPVSFFQGVNEHQEPVATAVNTTSNSENAPEGNATVVSNQENSQNNDSHHGVENK